MLTVLFKIVVMECFLHFMDDAPLFHHLRSEPVLCDGKIQWLAEFLR